MNNTTINANIFINFYILYFYYHNNPYINVYILYIMVDRYWRKIESVENNIENYLQISSILLKLKGYDEKLSDLSKIGNNENNISSNLGIINTNKSNISSNLKK